MLCNGRESESYVDTRMRIYNGLKQKSSLCLSSHVDSVSKAIKRVHHQNQHGCNVQVKLLLICHHKK